MKTVQTTAGPVKCRMYDLNGKRATTLRAMSNHFCRIAKGTTVNVFAYGKYTVIETDKCKCCRVQIRISRVPIEDLLFEPFQHDPSKGKKR